MKNGTMASGFTTASKVTRGLKSIRSIVGVAHQRPPETSTSDMVV